MSAIDKLTEYFCDLPGVGPRQARRFVYSLLTKNPAYLSEFSSLVLNIKNEVSICETCFRFFNNTKSSNCAICNSRSRDISSLLVVEKDVDAESIEKSGAYSGNYFILGGIIPILDKEPEKKVRLLELKDRVSKLSLHGLKEIILAFSVNAEGEYTNHFLEQFLSPMIKNKNIKITIPGRGLSTGSELEYADSDTLREAIKNRFAENFN